MILRNHRHAMHEEYCKLKTLMDTDTTKNTMFCLLLSSPVSCTVNRNAKIKVYYIF